jgi:hypothetical protein
MPLVQCGQRRPQVGRPQRHTEMFAFVHGTISPLTAPVLDNPEQNVLRKFITQAANASNIYVADALQPTLAVLCPTPAGRRRLDARPNRAESSPGKSVTYVSGMDY